MKARPGVMFAFTVFVFVLLSGNSIGQIKADFGVLDARKWNFEENRLPLTGRWIFFENQLLSSSECSYEKGIYSYFPSIWNDSRSDGSGQGYATYLLNVLVPDSTGVFSLEVPQLYSSGKLWVNGKLLVTIGAVGTSKKETRPQWISKTVSFTDPGDTLRIVLQIANFQHDKGGMKSPILLGTPKRIQQHWSWEIGSNMAEIIFVFLEGVAFFIIYLMRRDKNVILFFSLLCLTWSVRAAFSNLYPVSYFFPDVNWRLQVKIEYLTLYGGIIWSMLFLNLLFKNISKPIIAYLLVCINVFFVVFTLFTSPLVFSRWVNVYLTVAGITVAYGGIIVIQALMYEQVGAWFLLFSLLLGAAVFGYDIAAYESTAGYNLILLHIAYVVMFMLVTVGLLLHLDILKTKFGHSDILTYNDMVGKDDGSKKKK